MAIKQSQGFNLTASEIIDTRLARSKAEMLEYSQGSLRIKPSLYFCLCTDTGADRGKIYIWDKTKTPMDPVTGYYRPLESFSPDELSLILNGDGKAALKGFADALEGQIPKKTSAGLVWVDEPQGALPDNKAITKDSDNKLTLTGYPAAAQGKVPVKDEAGLRWETPASVEEIERAKATCNEKAIDCTVAKAQCDSVYTAISRKVWIGTLAQYQALTEIFEDSIYVIVDGALSFNG